LHTALETQSFALGQHCDTMFGHGAGQDDEVAGLCLPTIDGHPRWNHTNSRGVDEDLVGRALGHHFGIAGHELHAGPIQRLAYTGQDALQIDNRKSFFQNQSHAEITWLGAAHGHIVDRAVNRQVADIAARKKNRIDHESIGRKSQSDTVQLEHGAVVERRQDGVVEQGHQHFSSELVGDLAAAAMVKSYFSGHTSPYR
jgi:hypothetical protein